MKWSDCAVQDLKKYQNLKGSIQNIEERIEVLSMRFESVKGPKMSSTPTSGGGTQWEDKLLDNIVERKRLSMLLEADKKMIEIVERGLKRLNKEEMLVLEMFFINKIRDHVDILKERMNIEKSQVYRIKNQALYKFTISMYGIEEY